MRCIASHSSRCTMAIDFALSFDIVCSQPGSNHASMYAVKEIFLTLQGEGAQTGRRAVFCRFAGCNLWSGREEDRAEAVCKFCDTEFVETNGTVEPPRGLDWVCVSPKAGAELVVQTGNELKLVFPQQGAAPEAFADLAFEHFSLQPMDGPNVGDNTARAVAYCITHPQWRLSLQTHKALGIR